jgi:hypothetical protein
MLMCATKCSFTIPARRLYRRYAPLRALFDFCANPDPKMGRSTAGGGNPRISTRAIW